MHRSKPSKHCLKRFARIWVPAFFPPKCLACGVLMPHDLHNQTGKCSYAAQNTEAHGPLSPLFDDVMAPYLCASCLDAFMPATSPVCLRCGKPFNSSEGKDRICAACLANPKRHNLGKARFVGIYSAAFMDLIRALKYHGKIQLARPFGRLLRWAYEAYWESGEIDLIIPVPLHPSRLRNRGFNQSWLMVRKWPEAGSRCNTSVGVYQNILVRKRKTRPQIGLSPKQREDNIKGAFEVLTPSSVISKRILLVDDVFTTGATFNECAKVLLSAGAREVDALALARAL